MTTAKQALQMDSQFELLHRDKTWNTLHSREEQDLLHYTPLTLYNTLYESSADIPWTNEDILIRLLATKDNALIMQWVNKKGIEVLGTLADPIIIELLLKNENRLLQNFTIEEKTQLVEHNAIWLLSLPTQEKSYLFAKLPRQMQKSYLEKSRELSMISFIPLEQDRLSIFLELSIFLKNEYLDMLSQEEQKNLLQQLSFEQRNELGPKRLTKEEDLIVFRNAPAEEQIRRIRFELDYVVRRDLLENLTIDEKKNFISILFDLNDWLHPSNDEKRAILSLFHGDEFINLQSLQQLKWMNIFSVPAYISQRDELWKKLSDAQMEAVIDYALRININDNLITALIIITPVSLYPEIIKKSDSSGKILLHYIVNHEDCFSLFLHNLSAKLLLDLVKTRDSNGNTTLHYVDNAKTFARVLDIYPSNERLNALLIKNNDSMTSIETVKEDYEDDYEEVQKAIWAMLDNTEDRFAFLQETKGNLPMDLCDNMRDAMLDKIDIITKNTACDALSKCIHTPMNIKELQKVFKVLDKLIHTLEQYSLTENKQILEAINHDMGDVPNIKSLQKILKSWDEFTQKLEHLSLKEVQQTMKSTLKLVKENAETMQMDEYSRNTLF